MFSSLLGPAAFGVADNADAQTAAATSRFFDADDGWFDISGFLDTAYGFVPLPAPITDPAVGYGAAGALVFIDRHAPGEGQRNARPTIAALGGVATENGTRGLFAGHLGTWMDGNLRSVVGPVSGLPGVAPAGFDLRLPALPPLFTLDTGDNFSTPTHGWYVDLSVPLFREALGGDRDFDTATLTAMYYRPLSRSLFFAVCVGASASSDATPFYLRPFVFLRGVQAPRYQGEEAAQGWRAAKSCAAIPTRP